MPNGPNSVGSCRKDYRSGVAERACRPFEGLEEAIMTKWLRSSLAIAVIVSIAPAIAQGTRVKLTFTPETKTPEFEAAATEYRSIWAAEGVRVVQVMERITGLKFPQKDIKIQVFEGTSTASLLFDRAGVPVGSRDPMRFRASYSAENKKGTLIHELGHRMNLNLRSRPADLDEHRLLFLYLYDLYVDLYGKEFADGQVAFGRTLKGRYDYDAAWTWALAMTREERAARFAAILKANGKSGSAASASDASRPTT